ncbi:MAG TPA: polyprenyl glycosylphosphotransferase [Lachnospiraceae bacterium]|nr:polyprenyl glycosylphosphotransferase [Lachnospiraceae bacterium]
MEGIKHDVILRLVKVLDAVLITFPFALVWLFYYAERTWSPFYQKGNWAVIGLFLFLYAMFGKVYDAFCVSMNQMFESVYSQSLAALFSDSVMYIVSWLLTKHLPNPFPLFFIFFCQVIFAVIWFRLANKWYYSVFAPKKSAVIYDMRNGLERLVDEYGLAKKFDICLTEEVEECLKDIYMLDGLDAVFLSGIHSHDRNIILKYCVEKGIEVYVIPRIGDTIMSGAKQLHMFHLPILKTGRYNPSPVYLVVKRLVDIVVALAAFIVLSPAWLITAVAVKAEDGGNIFYRQCRLTKDGKIFDVLKFRSMKMDAERDGIARLSTGENDERLTKVGRIIRKVRLDELPQLLCILKGDMSIVGPRPERPEIAKQYEEEMPEFRLRLQAKAGLTGYAQVYGKYNTTPYDKLQMDLMYIAHPSMVEDFRIMLATVKILFLPESTEGVEEGAVTATNKNDFEPSYLNNTKVEVAAAGIENEKKAIKDTVKSGILP